MVAFNIEYRLAGSYTNEKLNTAEGMATDIITVIKYVLRNRNKYKIDPHKTILQGGSGGGYAVSTACGKMARDN